MADQYTKPQQLQQQPAKFYQHFLYKALIVSIFMFILPLLPPQSAPDFIGSGGWEFLHLVFVGLAVSYGLFSRRRIDEESSSDRKDDKFDAAQNYVSKFLPVDSVFDDEDVSTKVETWTSQYMRNEAVVVVADEDGDDGGGGGENRNRRFVRMEKPLLLPIRSLKSTESDFESRSRSDEDFRSENDSNSVLRSPIPWRSRSGRIQFDPVTAPSPPPPPPPPPPLVASSQSIRSRNSPKSSGSIPQFSSDEIQAKSAEDFVRRKTIFRSPPPPPPPPPPPSVRRRSTSRRPPPPPPPPPPPSVIRRSSSRRPSPSTSDHDQLPPVKSDDQQSRSERSHSFVEFPAAEDERIEKLVVLEEEDDDDSSSEAEEYEERKDRVLEFPLPDGSGEYDGEEDSPPLPPDVDRKADEFIAKFREQIRLQRMESIKRTADQVRKNRAARS